MNIFTKGDDNDIFVRLCVYDKFITKREWSGNIVMIYDCEERNEDNINGCNGIIKQCQPTIQIIQALHYYQHLNMTDNTDRQKLIKFVHDDYNQLLNDWIHFVSSHNDSYELQQLSEEMMKTYGLNECQMNECPLIVRHFRDRTAAATKSRDDNAECKTNGNDHDEKSEDNEFVFYRDLLDGIHCHLYHLEDIGLRIKVDNFANIHNLIKQKTVKMKQIKGLNNDRYNNNKYDLLGSSNQQPGIINICIYI